VDAETSKWADKLADPLEIGAHLDTVAGTTIARHGFGVLIKGASGAGKSDLALRAITASIRLPSETTPAAPFQMVSDDQTVLACKDDVLIASAPATLHGMMEVRGIGILPVEPVCNVPLILIAKISDGPIERMAPVPHTETPLLGCKVECVQIMPFEASAPVKLALMLEAAARRVHEQQIAEPGDVV